jgi:hypothetical protein
MDLQPTLCTYNAGSGHIHVLLEYVCYVAKKVL